MAISEHHLDQESVSAFRESFRKSQHIVIVAGAGLSAASGKHISLCPLFELHIIPSKVFPPSAMEEACGVPWTPQR